MNGINETMNQFTRATENINKLIKTLNLPKLYSVEFNQHNEYFEVVLDFGNEFEFDKTVSIFQQFNSELLVLRNNRLVAGMEISDYNRSYSRNYFVESIVKYNDNSENFEFKQEYMSFWVRYGSYLYLVRLKLKLGIVDCFEIEKTKHNCMVKQISDIKTPKPFNSVMIDEVNKQFIRIYMTVM